MKFQNCCITFMVAQLIAISAGAGSPVSSSSSTASSSSVVVVLAEAATANAGPQQKKHQTVVLLPTESSNPTSTIGITTTTTTISRGGKTARRAKYDMEIPAKALVSSSKKKIRNSSSSSRRSLANVFWQQVGDGIVGEASGNQLGRSVAMSRDGKRFIIGDALYGGNGIQSGHARVFQEVDGAWVQVGGDIDGETSFDRSGDSVAISNGGKRIIIGACYNNGIHNGVFYGHARVFQEVDGEWVQVGSGIGGQAQCRFSGTAVAISGDGKRFIIGAALNDGNARVFQEVDGAWVQMVGPAIDGEAPGDLSGTAVAFSEDGTRVIIGNSRNDGNGNNSGHARVFQEVDGAWVQVGSDIDGDAAYDNSAGAVAISEDGTRVIIGANGNDGNGRSQSGHARVFQEVDGAWVQVGGDIDGEDVCDYSGTGVAISGDGKRVIIGADENDGKVYGSDSGHARVFKEVDGEWVQVGSDIDGDAAYDYLGGSVAISGDGERIIISASGNDHAKVYQLTTSSLSPTSSSFYQASDKTFLISLLGCVLSFLIV